jgi:hypothetical protein
MTPSGWQTLLLGPVDETVPAAARAMVEQVTHAHDWSQGSSDFMKAYLHIRSVGPPKHWSVLTVSGSTRDQD